MNRYQILIEYVGTNFKGWQIQKKGNSIQKVIQSILSNLLKEKIPVPEMDAQIEIQRLVIENKKSGLLKFHLTKGDFRRFEGSWKIQELQETKGTCIFYELTVQGCRGMPVGLIIECNTFSSSIRIGIISSGYVSYHSYAVSYVALSLNSSS